MSKAVKECFKSVLEYVESLEEKCKLYEEKCNLYSKQLGKLQKDVFKYKIDYANVRYGKPFRHKIMCDNGYGISLVYHECSYGLECALIHKDKVGIDKADKRFNEFCGGDSVKGHMNGNDLSDVLNLVKSFPKLKESEA